MRFFPHKVKNIKHDRYFPQGLESSNPHENYPHTRATLAELAAICEAPHIWQLAQQVLLSCVAGFMGKYQDFGGISLK